MSDAFWVAALKPFFVLAIIAIFGIPMTWAVRKWMRPGRVKSLLLDRTLVERRPWIGWLFAIGGFAAMFLMGALGLWLHSL